MITQIEVENIKCGGCMNSITSALMGLKNIQEVEIDKDRDTIHIRSEQAIDRLEIADKLLRMGYPEKGSNNLMLKAKSYVSCAIGNLKDKL